MVVGSMKEETKKKYISIFSQFYRSLLCPIGTTSQYEITLIAGMSISMLLECDIDTYAHASFAATQLTDWFELATPSIQQSISLLLSNRKIERLENAFACH